MELFNLESEKILQKQKDERTHLFLWWPSSWPLAHHTHLYMTPHGSSRKQSLFRQKHPKHTLPFLFHCSSFSSLCSWVAGSVLQPSIWWLICRWPLDYSIIRHPFLHVGSLCPWVQISAISVSSKRLPLPSQTFRTLLFRPTPESLPGDRNWAVYLNYIFWRICSYNVTACNSLSDSKFG